MPAVLHSNCRQMHAAACFTCVTVAPYSGAYTWLVRTLPYEPEQHSNSCTYPTPQQPGIVASASGPTILCAQRIRQHAACALRRLTAARELHKEAHKCLNALLHVSTQQRSLSPLLRAFPADRAFEHSWQPAAPELVLVRGLLLPRMDGMYAVGAAAAGQLGFLHLLLQHPRPLQQHAQGPGHCRWRRLTHSTAFITPSPLGTNPPVVDARCHCQALDPG